MNNIQLTPAELATAMTIEQAIQEANTMVQERTRTRLIYLDHLARVHGVSAETHDLTDWFTGFVPKAKE